MFAASLWPSGSLPGGVGGVSSRRVEGPFLLLAAPNPHWGYSLRDPALVQMLRKVMARPGTWGGASGAELSRGAAWRRQRPLSPSADPGALRTPEAQKKPPGRRRRKARAPLLRLRLAGGKWHRGPGATDSASTPGAEVPALLGNWRSTPSGHTRGKNASWWKCSAFRSKLGVNSSFSSFFFFFPCLVVKSRR